MSNRFVSQSKNDYRGSAKPQKKFVPKRDSQSPNSYQTLSNTLRANSSAATNTSSGGGGGDAVAASTNGDGEYVNRASTSGNFVIYLPQDEAVAAGLGAEEGGLDPVESQRVVDLLNRELSRLLKLSPRDFWREVATDESLNAFLESFLKFRSRWYDFPHRGAKGIVAGVIVDEVELCRRVFMVLYRLSSNRDPGAKAADSLSPKDHGALLQEKKLLDLPKLLDICAIYGHANEELTQTLVANAIKVQPYIQDGFTVLILHFMSIVQTMHQRCNSTLEGLLSSGGRQDQGSSRLHLDYLEVMDFINDSVVSLDSFVNAQKHAAVFFSSPVEMSYGNEELLTTLARLHDSLLPSLMKGFRIILGVTEDRNKEISSDLLSNASTSLKILSSRIANFGWRVLYLCYLSDEAFENSYSLPVSMKMFPANVEDPVVRADILIQTIRDLTIDHIDGPGGRTFIQEIEKNHKMMSRIELLRNTSWLSMDDGQFQFLAGIMATSTQADSKHTSSTSVPASSYKTKTDEDVAIVESKISQIKELFPDYGRGFLVACLEAYNQDTEQVIQRILEGTLHEELQSLDISLETILPSKSASSVSNHDKGKGKLVESAVSAPEAVVPTAVNYQAGASLGYSSSSSSVGRFTRKNMNDLPNSETLNDKSEKELIAKTAVLASQLEYEDEYDDSFDDLGLSVGDSGLEESETLQEKHAHRGRATEADTGSSSSNADKWGSRKKPQFYVKDGRNYSYKVDGSVAVANFNEAKLVNLAQKELVHGLGRGGNIPLGTVKRLTESTEEQNDERDTDESGRRGGRGTARGRGRRGFSSSTVQMSPESNEQQEGQDNEEVGGRGSYGNSRGGGRRGRGRNNFRKDRAMSKQFAGLPGHYN